MIKSSIWYNKAPLMSYKAFFNILISARGLGKTYSFKSWCIDDFLKTGAQFVWLRRYATEIEKMKKTFFDDIREKYKNVDFNIKGDNKAGQFYINNKLAGFYFALSTSSIAKSSSYPHVNKIVFDEFLIMGKTYHYLNDEVTLLLEFIETIYRLREVTDTKYKPKGVYLLGNNITLANPYFLYFNIKPFKTRFYHDKERSLLVEQYTNKAFVETKSQTAIGRLTKDTDYYEYAIENKPYLDNDTFIKKKPPKAEFRCAIDYNNRCYGFWLDIKNGLMYVNYQVDPSSYRHYSLTRDDHSVNTFLIKNSNNTAIKEIVWLFQNGCLFFEDEQIKAQVYEILSHFIK